tara:strand:+ start:1003 stop:1281 length:279 start_codon:yes stop_codon:yes gene_type:complete
MSEEFTRVVKLTGSWGGLKDFHMTKQECLELIEQGGRWVFNAERILIGTDKMGYEEVFVDWDSLGDEHLVMFPALIGGSTSSTPSPQVGEEE